MEVHHLEMSVAECSNTSAPLVLSIASASVSALLLTVTVPTNLLVCLAIILDPNRELRTQFNCFTFNLALADLIVGCVAEPVSIYAHITEAFSSHRGHEVSPVVLKMFHIPYFISAMASALSIAALAFERYLAINSPFRYRRYFDVKITVVFSIFIWTIALSFGMLNLIFNYILESFLFINSGVLFTGCMVSFAGCRIRANLQKTSTKWQDNGAQSELQRRDNRTQTKLTKTFVLMTGTLLMCYIPASSMVYFINLCTHCNCELIQWFRDIAFWLVLLNSAIDPYVYAVRSSTFRDAIYKILKFKCQEQKSKNYPAFKFSKGQEVNARYGSLINQYQCQIQQ